MPDSNWAFSEPKSSEVSQHFDPSALGFTQYMPRRFYGSSSMRDKDYLVCTVQRRTDNSGIRLSMCEDTANFVNEVIGNRCNIYFNDKGQLLLAPGKSLSITHNKAYTKRAMVSINGLYDALVERYGTFKHLYLTSKIYANGNAVLFSFNGERD